MDIECTLKNLQAAMKAVKQIHSKAPGGEDVSHDCLVASQDDRSTIKLESASNGLYCSVMIPAEVETPGAVVIKREALTSLRPRAEAITFKHKDGDKLLAFQAGEFKGNMAVSEGLDEIKARRPLQIPELSFGLPSEALKTAVKRLCFQASKPDDGPLKMRIHVSGKTLTMSTHDSYRAAAHWTTLEEDVPETTVVIPAHFFANCCGVMDDDEIRFGATNRVIRIKAGGVDVCHPVLQGTASDIIDAAKRFTSQPIISTSHFSAGAAYDAVDQVMSIIPKSLANGIRLDIQVRPNGTMKAGVKYEHGFADCRFPAQAVEAAGVSTFAFNAKFMVEFLKLLPSDHEVKMIAVEKKVILRTDDQVLIMPQLAKNKAKQAA